MNPTSAPTQALQGSPGLVPQFEQILRKDGFYANFYIAAAAPVPAAGCTVPIFVAFFPCQVISVAISWNPAGTGTAAIQVEQLPLAQLQVVETGCLQREPTRSAGLPTLLFSLELFQESIQELR